MDLRIKEVNNGYVIYNDDQYAPGTIRLGETTNVACDIDGLCAVIKKIHAARENSKQAPRPEVKTW